MEHSHPSSTTTIEVDREARNRKRSHNEMNGGKENERRREDSSTWLPGPSNSQPSERSAALHGMLSQKREHHSRERPSQQPSSSSTHRPSSFDYSRISHEHPTPRPERSQVDLRRPIMPSSITANFIDLTEDETPPRPTGPIRLRLPSPRPHDRQIEPEIITLDTGRSERRRSPPQRPSSPEIEFLSERTVPQPERPTTVARDEGVNAARRAAQPGRLGNLWNLLRANPTEEAMQTYAREAADRNARQDHARRERALAGLVRDATAQRLFRGRIVGDMLRLGGRIDAMDEDFELADDIPMNIMMDYDATGFAMGPTGRRASPPYIEPSPAPEGFIKSTEEDDIVICPNCSDEVGVGQDPLKRQVWIAKGCGHVYCGECTKNRPVKKGPKSQKLPLKTKPFSKCVVEECGKSVSAPKSMIPLYL